MRTAPFFAIKPVDPNPYNYAEAVVTPDGRTMLCMKSWQYTYCK
jgi:hypothetical protein